MYSRMRSRVIDVDFIIVSDLHRFERFSCYVSRVGKTFQTNRFQLSPGQVHHLGTRSCSIIPRSGLTVRTPLGGRNLSSECPDPFRVRGSAYSDNAWLRTDRHQTLRTSLRQLSA